MARQKQMPGSTRGAGITRRQAIKAIGTGAAAVAGAGAGLFGGKAPAFGQEIKLHILQPGSFVPASDAIMDVMAAEFGKMAGCKVTTEYLGNPNDVPPRAIAAVESGVGPDIIMLPWNQAFLYGTKFADVGDVVEATLGKRVVPSNKAAVFVNGVYRGVPAYNIPSVMTYNKGICEPAGVTKYATTYEELRELGKKIKKADRPIGWCLGHTVGDGAFGNYMIFWAYGGAEVDPKGRVIINSKETLEACKFMRAFWKDACDEGGMAWSDSNNNQAYLGESVGCVYNAASIYIKIRTDQKAAAAKGDQAMADKWKKLADNTVHTLQPKGPAGSYALVLPFNLHVPTYGKNIKLAKDWLKYLMTKPQYERWFTSFQGFATGNTPEWDKHPMWKIDPQIEPFRDVNKYSRTMGFHGPFNQASSEAQSKYIIADMLARSINDTPESAVKWAESELKLIYRNKA